MANEGLNRIEQLRASGFSEGEIADWESTTRQQMLGGGFSDEEVDQYFGIPKKPDFKPLADQARKNIESLLPAAPVPTEIKPGTPTEIPVFRDTTIPPKETAPKVVPEFPPLAPVEARARDEQSKDEVSSVIDTIPGEIPFTPVLSPEEQAQALSGKTEAKTILDFLEAGYQWSNIGLALRGRMPDILMPEDVSTFENIAHGAGMLLGDIPSMIVGALAGSTAGGGTGSVAPVVGTATGSVIGAGAGAFMAPEMIRKALIDMYQDGSIDTFQEFWERFSALAITGFKAGEIGALTMMGGGAAGQLAKNAPKIAQTAATTTGEIITMIAVGHAIEGQMPTKESFISAAILIGGLKASIMVSTKLQTIFIKTGLTPEQVARHAQTEPTIKQDLMSPDVEIPKAYEPIVRQNSVAIKETPEPQIPAEMKVQADQLKEPKLTPKSEEAVVLAETDVISRVVPGVEKPMLLTFDHLYTDIKDDLHPIKQLEKYLNGGKLLAAEQSPYTQWRLNRGAFGMSDHFLEFGTFDINTKKINGPGLKQVLSPVKNDLGTLNLDDIAAEGGGFRAYAVSRRALELNKKGIKTGVDPKAADAVVKAGRVKYEQTFRNLVDYQARLTKTLLDSGIIDKKTYDLMLEANKDYVPFYRLMDDQVSGGPGGGGTIRNPIKRIKGSERQILDPIESIIKNTYLYIRLAHQNAATVKLIEESANSILGPGVIKKVKTPIKPVKLDEREIRKIFDTFVKTSTKTSTSRTETTTKGEAAEPTGKIFETNKKRVVEALTSRGFSENEAEIMVRRLQLKGGEAVDTLVKEVTTTEQVAELDMRLPTELATIFRPAPKQRLLPNEIAVYRKGKREVYEVPIEVAQAIKGADSATMALWMKIMALPAKGLRAGSVLTPEFIARNLIRDANTAFILSENGFIPGWTSIQGLGGLLGKGDAYQQWIRNGGANATLMSIDQHYIQTHIFKLSKDTGLIDKTWNLAKSPLEILRTVGELAENSTRLGEFKLAMKKGKSPTQAAMESREITLDFARIGAKTRALNMISAFFNAHVEGMDRNVRGFKANPLAFTAKAGLSITLPSVLLWWANHDDPRWRGIPQWQKDIFWIVLTDDHIIRIPKPFEMGIVFGSIPERVLEAYFTDNPEAMKDLDKTMMTAIAPELIPNIMSAPMEQFANQSMFTQAPLIPYALEKGMTEYQYTPYTTEVAKSIGRIIGSFGPIQQRLLRDNKVGNGVLRTFASPALIEHYIRSWSGGLGMYTLQIADKGLREAGVLPDRIKPTKTLADIPVVKAFVIRYPSAGDQNIQNFYEEYFARQKVVNSLRSRAQVGDIESIERITTIDQNKAALIQLDGIRTSLSRMTRIIQLIDANPEMTGDEKRQQIDDLYTMMIDQAKLGNLMIKAIDDTLAKKESKPDNILELVMP